MLPNTQERLFLALYPSTSTHVTSVIPPPTLSSRDASSYTPLCCQK